MHLTSIRSRPPLVRIPDAPIGGPRFMAQFEYRAVGTNSVADQVAAARGYSALQDVMEDWRGMRG